MTSYADPPKETGTQKSFGYREVIDQLLADIRAGQVKVGDQLSTEGELVDRFGASRNTIRQALQELETFGYIKRRRGTRSILVSAQPRDDFVNSVRSIGEMLQYSRRTKSTLLVIEKVIAGPDLAERLDAKVGSEWLRIEYLRKPLRGGLPLGYSEIYIDGRYGGISDAIGDQSVIYPLIEEKYGVLFRRVEQTIQATAATANIASRLTVAIDSPILSIRTKFVTSAGIAAEIGFGHFPAGRYSIAMVLERGGHRVAE